MQLPFFAGLVEKNNGILLEVMDYKWEEADNR